MKRLLLAAALTAAGTFPGIAGAQTTTTTTLPLGCNPTGQVTANGDPIILCVDLTAPATTSTTVRPAAPAARPATPTAARRVALTG